MATTTIITMGRSFSDVLRDGAAESFEVWVLKESTFVLKMPIFVTDGASKGSFVQEVGLTEDEEINAFNNSDNEAWALSNEIEESCDDLGEAITWTSSGSAPWSRAICLNFVHYNQLSDCLIEEGTSSGKGTGQPLERKPGEGGLGMLPLFGYAGKVERGFLVERVVFEHELAIPREGVIVRELEKFILVHWGAVQQMLEYSKLKWDLELLSFEHWKLKSCVHASIEQEAPADLVILEAEIKTLQHCSQLSQGGCWVWIRGVGNGDFQLQGMQIA
ncbi:hypothetical protein L218DRAFT_948724 [Marasmius fiardii PR-910]|nr:hypothetical protein L218DRAFT_948724 [Marasmius fiardii PR-910]